MWYLELQQPFYDHKWQIWGDSKKIKKMLNLTLLKCWTDVNSTQLQILSFVWHLVPFLGIFISSLVECISNCQWLFHAHLFKVRLDIFINIFYKILNLTYENRFIIFTHQKKKKSVFFFWINETIIYPTTELRKLGVILTAIVPVIHISYLSLRPAALI